MMYVSRQRGGSAVRTASHCNGCCAGTTSDCAIHLTCPLERESLNNCTLTTHEKTTAFSAQRARPGNPRHRMKTLPALGKA
jgi:hypothetical protein